MKSFKTITKLTAVTGSGIAMAAYSYTRTVHAAKKVEQPCEKSSWMRASELPIYPPEEKELPKTQQQLAAAEADDPMIKAVRAARIQVMMVVRSVGDICDKANEFIDTGVAHTQSTVAMLRAEENLNLRVGAITIGGLIGMSMATRRGWFKRILYATLGAGGMAAMCYPEQASDYGQRALKQVRHYAIIGYHFTNGGTQQEAAAPASVAAAEVKPVDRPKACVIPDIPDMVADVYSEAIPDCACLPTPCPYPEGLRDQSSSSDSDLYSKR